MRELISSMPKECAHLFLNTSTICTNHANACCRNGLKFSEIVKRTLGPAHPSQASALLSIGDRETHASARSVRCNVLVLTRSGAILRNVPVRILRKSGATHPPTHAARTINRRGVACAIGVRNPRPEPRGSSQARVPEWLRVCQKDAPS